MTTAIALGSVIEIVLNGGEPMTIRIRKPNVPDEVSKPGVTLVSSDAPIAKALLNAQEGEEIEFTVGDKLNHVRVLKILS